MSKRRYSWITCLLNIRQLFSPPLNTGLRQGELLRLTWADIDWNVGVLTVNETKAGGTPSNADEFNRSECVD